MKSKKTYHCLASTLALLAGCLSAQQTISPTPMMMTNSTKTTIPVPVIMTNYAQTTIPDFENSTVSNAQTAVAWLECSSSLAIPTIVTSNIANYEPALVVFLVDEMATRESSGIIFSALESSLQMGDRIIFFNKNTLIADETIGISYNYPVLPPSPTPPSTNSTQNLAEYKCSIYEWNVEYQTIYSEWKSENQRNFDSSIQLLRNELEFFDWKQVKNTSFESLTHASYIFDSTCSDYEQCILVIIASTKDNIQPPSDIYTTFDKFEIVGTITDCWLQIQECLFMTHNWERYLSDKNAYSVDFVNFDELWDTLVKIIYR